MGYLGISLGSIVNSPDLWSVDNFLPIKDKMLIMTSSCLNRYMLIQNTEVLVLVLVLNTFVSLCNENDFCKCQSGSIDYS